MFINAFTLNKYKFFKLSNIKNFIWNSIGKVSIIQGKNGSGKSSLLKELLRIPSRTSFSKDGSSTMSLEHGGAQYELTADFNNQTSPHSFIKNGIELNISGTTKIQQELIETHLGLTPTMCKLLTIGFDIANMTPSFRNKLLSDLNPMNMALVLNKHKIVSAKLRACKNNLTLLYKRKEEIQQQMLQPEVLSEIYKNKELLEQQKSLLVLLQYTLTDHLTKLREIQVSQNDIDIQKIEYELSIVDRRSVRYKFIDRTTHKENTIKLQLQQDSIRKELIDIEESTQKIISDINKYEKYLNDKSVNEVVTMLNTNIQEIQAVIAELDISPDYPALTQTEHTNVVNKLNTISDLLNTFISDNLKGIQLPDTLNGMKTQLDRLQEVVSYNKSQCDFIQRELASLNTKIDKTKVVIPNNCPTTQCELFVKYNQNLTTDTTRHSELTEQLLSSTKQIQAAQQKISELEVFYNKANSFDIRYNQLITILTRDLSGLNSIVQQIDNTLLNNQPLLILNLIKTHIRRSEDWYRFKECNRELETLKARAEKTINEKQPPRDLLDELIRSNKMELKNKQQKYDSLKQNIAAITHQLKIYDRYQKDVDHINNLTEFVKQCLYTREVQQSIAYYQKLLNSIQTVSHNIDTELYSVNQTYKEQEQLQNRLTEEILKMISDVETEYKKYHTLESALSPSTGLPHKYMVVFLNSIIKNANIFISKVFTYPLVIYKFDHDTPLSYKFKIRVGDESIGDISECSSGQKDIINLALSLATILQLHLDEYPVFIDEVDKAIDEMHKQELLNLFVYLIDNNVVKQLFMVIHHTTMSGMVGDNVVLGDINTLNVDTFNEYIEIKKY